WADLLISVGDLIDRGPQSADCLGLLRCRWFRAVRGNHEQMALEALESGDMALWQMNGGDWYGRGTAQQRAEADRLLARCQRLPLIIEVGCADAR
ncbi:metallophosphoesterase, partial [Klebsiella pneumoniae]